MTDGLRCDFMDGSVALPHISLMILHEVADLVKIIFNADSSPSAAAWTSVDRADISWLSQRFV